MAQNSPPSSDAQSLAALAERGDAFAAAGNYRAALRHFDEAMGLAIGEEVPRETRVWLHTARGDAHFQLGEFREALDALGQARVLLGAADNPFLSLRTGQAQLHLGHEKAAYTHLLDAFALGGERLFGEDDPSYLAWLVARVRQSG